MRCVLPRHPYACGKTVIYHLPFEISESIYLLDPFFFILASSFLFSLRHCMRMPMNQLHICRVRSPYYVRGPVDIVWNKNNHWNNKNVLFVNVDVGHEAGANNLYAKRCTVVLLGRWSTRISAIKFICSCVEARTRGGAVIEMVLDAFGWLEMNGKSWNGCLFDSSLIQTHRRAQY